MTLFYFFKLDLIFWSKLKTGEIQWNGRFRWWEIEKWAIQSSNLIVCLTPEQFKRSELTANGWVVNTQLEKYLINVMNQKILKSIFSRGVLNLNVGSTCQTPDRLSFHCWLYEKFFTLCIKHKQKAQWRWRTFRPRWVRKGGLGIHQINLPICQNSLH